MLVWKKRPERLKGAADAAIIPDGNFDFNI